MWLMGSGIAEEPSEVLGTRTLRRIRYTTDLGFVALSDLVVEAVAEQEDAKIEVFEALDKTC